MTDLNDLIGERIRLRPRHGGRIEGEVHKITPGGAVLVGSRWLSKNDVDGASVERVT